MFLHRFTLTKKFFVAVLQGRFRRIVFRKYLVPFYVSMWKAENCRKNLGEERNLNFEIILPDLNPA